MLKKIKILNLCSYFSGVSAVYENLFSEIDELNHSQIVYVPYRKIKRNKKIDFSSPESKIIWRPILNEFSRYTYLLKIRKIFNDVKKSVNIDNFDIIHAHSWYTDGGVAYKLYNTYNIPYVVTIRSTDLNTFAKYFYHTRPLARKILQNASKIIFVSAVYKKRTFQLPFLRKLANQLESKSIVLPNGIDSYWINHTKNRKIQASEIIKLIYVGNFLKRKNVLRLIEAVNLLKSKGKDIKLDIVGGGRQYNDALLEVIEKNPNVNFIGKIMDKSILSKKLQQNDIFVMPSYNETFGLVYIEALSQGIPVVYSKNEGIDGFHGSNIGEAIDPKKVESIADGILKTYNSYEDYNFSPKEIVQQHNWKKIARKLSELYSSNTKQN